MVRRLQPERWPVAPAGDPGPSSCLRGRTRSSTRLRAAVAGGGPGAAPAASPLAEDTAGLGGTVQEGGRPWAACGRWAAPRAPPCPSAQIRWGAQQASKPRAARGAGLRAVTKAPGRGGRGEGKPRRVDTRSRRPGPVSGDACPAGAWGPRTLAGGSLRPQHPSLRHLLCRDRPRRPPAPSAGLNRRCCFCFHSDSVSGRLTRKRRGGFPGGDGHREAPVPTGGSRALTPRTVRSPARSPRGTGLRGRGGLTPPRCPGFAPAWPSRPPADTGPAHRAAPTPLPGRPVLSLRGTLVTVSSDRWQTATVILSLSPCRAPRLPFPTVT